jgi:putative lumazine-binding protein
VTAEDAIRRAVLDYFEGWMDADAERMRRALHPALAKRALDDDGRLDETSADWMIAATGDGRGRRDDPEARRLEIEIEDVHGGIASVTVRDTVYREYVHLLETRDGWKIVNTLYARA